jgi:hypothetical protein
MANKKTSICQMVLVVFLIVFAIWLFSNISPMAKEVKCIVDGIDELKVLSNSYPGTAAGITAQQMGDAVPDSTLDPIKMAGIRTCRSKL